MSQAKIIFERPAEVEFAPAMTRTLPKTLRNGAATRREPLQFVPDVQPVMIVAVKIPFFSLVWQLIKLALAALPAIFVLGVGLWGSIVLYSLLAPELSHLLSSVWLDLTQLKTP